MDEESTHPIRLMNFVSEQQLDEAKRARGERVEDGTAQRDRPLYEILKENKDKRDAEFNERFKHRPPKALDEDETEFLDKLEMSRQEYERQMADEEAEQLRSFQAAVAAKSNTVHELKEPPPVPVAQEQKPVAKKHPAAHPLSMIIKVKPQAKKAKTGHGSAEEPSETAKMPEVDARKTPDPAEAPNGETKPDSTKTTEGDANKYPDGVAKTCLVSYSDESEDDD
ncbi:hypothetical protein SLA2020_064860 [Shorea laevis]